MIKMTMKYLGRTVKLDIPTDYEQVIACLWKLGLKHDPSKYTLHQLGCTFSYDTADEHQIIRMISSSMTLLDALVVLHHMIAPPYPMAARVRAGLRGCAYRSPVSMLGEIDKIIDAEAAYKADFYFPISGDLADCQDNRITAPNELLEEYKEIIAKALSYMRGNLFWNMTWYFSEIDEVFEKLLAAHWFVELVQGKLVCRVMLLLNDELDETELRMAAERVEEINGLEIAPRLKEWSVLTDRGILYVDLCDNEGDYGIIFPDEDDKEEYEPCGYPECMTRMQRSAVHMDQNEYEEEQEDMNDS